MPTQPGHFVSAFVNIEMRWRRLFKDRSGTRHFLDGAVRDNQKTVRFKGFLILDDAVLRDAKAG